VKVYVECYSVEVFAVTLNFIFFYRPNRGYWTWRSGPPACDRGQAIPKIEKIITACHPTSRSQLLRLPFSYNEYRRKKILNSFSKRSKHIRRLYLVYGDLTRISPPGLCPMSPAELPYPCHMSPTGLPYPNPWKRGPRVIKHQLHSRPDSSKDLGAI